MKNSCLSLDRCCDHHPICSLGSHPGCMGSALLDAVGRNTCWLKAILLFLLCSQCAGACEHSWRCACLASVRSAALLSQRFHSSLCTMEFLVRNISATFACPLPRHGSVAEALLKRLLTANAHVKITIAVAAFEALMLLSAQAPVPLIWLARLIHAGLDKQYSVGNDLLNAHLSEEERSPQGPSHNITMLMTDEDQPWESGTDVAPAAMMRCAKSLRCSSGNAAPPCSKLHSCPTLMSQLKRSQTCGALPQSKCKPLSLFHRRIG